MYSEYFVPYGKYILCKYLLSLYDLVSPFLMVSLVKRTSPFCNGVQINPYFGFRVSTFCGLLIKKKNLAYPRVTNTFFHVISYEHDHLASQATWLSSGACHTIQTCFAPVDASGFFVQWLFLSLSTPWGFLTPAPLVLRLAVSLLGQ